MGLIEKIEELQKRPEAERKKIFGITLSLSMLIVFGIWLSLLGHTIRSWGEEKTDNTPAPLGLVLESVNGAFSDLRQGVTAEMNNIK